MESQLAIITAYMPRRNYLSVYLPLETGGLRQLYTCVRRIRVSVSFRLPRPPTRDPFLPDTLLVGLRVPRVRLRTSTYLSTPVYAA